MTTTYFPFDSGDGADSYEDRWTLMARLWRPSGPVPVGDNLEVYGDSSGMQVKVRAGKAWVMGHYFGETAETTLAIAAADSTNPRIDRVVLRLSWSDNTIGLVAVAGTAAASPSAPALTNSATIWDIALAQVYIPASASSITANDVFDERSFSRQTVNSDGRISCHFKLPYEYSKSEVHTAPSSTNTTSETVTFGSAMPWRTGQLVRVSATGGGLTSGVGYYVATSDYLTYSFHTTLRDALGGTNKVNLTGNIQPNTLGSAGIYLNRFNGNLIDVYVTDVGVVTRTIPENGVYLSCLSLSASTLYDIFVYDDGGVLALEAVAWTTSAAGTSARNGSYTPIDSVYGFKVKTGSLTKRFIGTILTNSSGYLVDNATDRRVVNYHNRMPKYMTVAESTNHNYNGALRKWNNSDTNNLLTYLVCFSDYSPIITANAALSAGADGSQSRVVIYTNGTATNASMWNLNNQVISGTIFSPIGAVDGWNIVQLYEFSNHSSTLFSLMTMDAIVSV